MRDGPIDVATKDFDLVQSDMLTTQAVAILNERKIDVLIAVGNAKCPKGELHFHDLYAGVA